MSHPVEERTVTVIPVTHPINAVPLVGGAAGTHWMAPGVSSAEHSAPTGCHRDQGDDFSLPIGHSMTISYYDTKNLNLVLRRMKQPRPSLCILCVYQDPRK